MEKKFFRCEVCGNLVGVIHSGGGPLHCCGQPMVYLVANSTDGAGEKHVPAVSFGHGLLKVQVGEVLHPMMTEHYIQWIVVSQGDKTQRVELRPGEKPMALFVLDEMDKPFIVYEYCNLHGLWEYRKGF